MKVQWQQQKIRLRINETELSQLLDGQPVSNNTRLPDGTVWQQILSLVDADEPSLLPGFHLQWPRQEINALAARLPCRDGVHVNFSLPDHGKLEVIIEVDVRDSARQRLSRQRSPHSPPLS